eukprot:346782-Amorphochlora_amoeboformis.AAC.1
MIRRHQHGNPRPRETPWTALFVEPRAKAVREEICLSQELVVRQIVARIRSRGRDAVTEGCRALENGERGEGRRREGGCGRMNSRYGEAGWVAG